MTQKGRIWTGRDSRVSIENYCQRLSVSLRMDPRCCEIGHAPATDRKNPSARNLTLISRFSALFIVHILFLFRTPDPVVLRPHESITKNIKDFPLRFRRKTKNPNNISVIKLQTVSFLFATCVRAKKKENAVGRII